MYIVDLDRENFEYDVQALVKSFYPEEQVQVLTPATREETRRSLEGSARLRIRIGETQAEFVLDGRRSFFDCEKRRKRLPPERLKTKARLLMRSSKRVLRTVLRGAFIHCLRMRQESGSHGEISRGSALPRLHMACLSREKATNISLIITHRDTM